VVDADCGILVPAGNFEAFAAAITRLIQNPEERLALGEKARARVLARPTWRDVAQSVVDGLDDQGWPG
jgi:glycosyltransferase involved in cell wall biosynthesis